MSTVQFYLRDLAGNHHYTIDPVKSLDENDTQWIIDNGYRVYEIEKSEYEDCTAFVRLTPQDNEPLHRMSEYLKAFDSSVKIEW